MGDETNSSYPQELRSAVTFCFPNKILYSYNAENFPRDTEIQKSFAKRVV